MPKGKRKHADGNNNHFVQTTLASSFFKSSAKKKEVPVKPELPPKPGCQIDNKIKPECCELMIFVLHWEGGIQQGLKSSRTDVRLYAKNYSSYACISGDVR